MSKETDSDANRTEPINNSDVQIPPSPFHDLSLAKGLTRSFDPDHCEFCGGVIDEQTDECPARGAGRCRP